MTLPPIKAVATPTKQMALVLETAAARRSGSELLPGVVHIPDWLDTVAQRELADEFRLWAVPPAGLRIFHGVPKVAAGTAPDALGLPAGRLSITVHETGFS